MTRMERRRRNRQKKIKRTLIALLLFVTAAALMTSFAYRPNCKVIAADPAEKAASEQQNLALKPETDAIKLAATTLTHRDFRISEVYADEPEEEPKEEPEITEAPARSDEEVNLIAKTVYGEALITGSDTEMSAVVWCILNRVDFYDSDISTVVTAKSQFHGYDDDNPIDEHIKWLVRDVLDRWEAEKSGETDVGRTLPAEYRFFTGDGWHNHFTTEFGGGKKWDWSLPSPYES